MIININHQNFDKHYNKITEILKELINEHRLENTLKNLSEYLKDNKAILKGHVIDNELSSIIWAHKRNFFSEERFHISYILVVDEHRGKGLANELIAEIIKEAKKFGISKIDLNVSSDNEIALSVYKKLGFTSEKILMTKEI